MGHRIVKQDNGLWAVYSTVSDTILVVDCTQEELFEYEGNYAKQRAIDTLEIDFELMGKGHKRPGIQTDPEDFVEILRSHCIYKDNCDDPDFNKAIADKLAEVSGVVPVEVTNIEWDCEGQPQDECGVPSNTTVFISKSLTEEIDIRDAIGVYLFNDGGFNVVSFDYGKATNEG